MQISLKMFSSGVEVSTKLAAWLVDVSDTSPCSSKSCLNKIMNPKLSALNHAAMFIELWKSASHHFSIKNPENSKAFSPGKHRDAVNVSCGSSFHHKLTTTRRFSASHSSTLKIN